MKAIEIIKRPFRIYSGLERSIYVLFFARIINSLGFFVYPFLTLLLTNKLGYSAKDAGVILMVCSTSFVPGSLIGGKLSDHIGRKKLLVTAQLCSAACFLSCAFLKNQQLIPFFIIGAEFFMGVVHPTSQAMVFDLSRPENRKAAFSLLYLGHNIGFAVGPLLAGFLYNNHTRWLFAGDAITTFISVMLVIFLVAETKPDSEQLRASMAEAEKGGNSSEHAVEGSVFKVLFQRPILLWFVFLVMLLNFVYAQMSFSLPIFMNDTFGTDGPMLFGSAMSFNAVVVIAGTTLIISATKNMKPILATALTAVLYAFGFGAIYFAKTFALIIITAFIWTTGEILGATNIDVFIANHTPMSHRGRINSIVPIIMGTGQALSPFLVGAFIEIASVEMVWPLCFILAMIAAAGFTVMYFSDKKKDRKQPDAGQTLQNS